MEKHYRRFTLVLFIMVIIILAVAGCGTANEPADTAPETEAEEVEVHEGQALVEKKCVGCHGLDRLDNANYDKDGWTFSVDQMIINGTQLNDEERELVIDYLAIAYPKE
jgi:mono/diheme cytochrome c family protein